MKIAVHTFALADGWTAQVGRSDLDNDALTFKVVFPQDYWLHAKGCPGSHVLLHHAEAHEAPKDVLEAAARLAITYSKARKVKKGAVSVARIADIAKPKNAPAGQVILRKSQTIQVYMVIS